jgi:hypothetical protein
VGGTFLYYGIIERKQKSLISRVSGHENIRAMIQIVVLEWNYSPPDYFEQDIKIERVEYDLRIGNGKATARVMSSAYDASPNYRHSLHESLSNRFLAIQLLTHRVYNLSMPSMYRLHPDGRKDVTLIVESLFQKQTTSSIDLIVKDKNEKVISDTRQDRINSNLNFANLVEKHSKTDDVLRALLKSYNDAVKDPDNELVYIYEIRDAIAHKFGDECNAESILGISKNKWSRIGALANDEPLKQGRHRGKNIGSIARLIVKSYLIWLDKGS